MQIEEIIVHVNTGRADAVVLQTDIPSGFPQDVDRTRTAFKTEVRAGTGLQFARIHFPNVPKAVLDLKTGKTIRGYL